MKRSLLIALALFTVLFIFGFTQASRPITQQWEYKTVTIKTYMFVSSSAIDIDKVLNDMGGAGWELVAHDNVRNTDTSDLTRLYFKRQK